MATPEAELQAIFSRIEKAGITSVTDIRNWLAGPKKSPGSYTNASNIFAEPFGLRESVKKAKTFEDVSSISDSARLMVVRDRTTLNEVERLEKEAKISSDLLRDSIKETNINNLRKYLQRSETLKISKEQIIDAIKLDISTAEDIEEREKEISEKISRESIRLESKEKLSSSEEERRDELRRLRQEEPQRLGGFRRAELSRGRKALGFIAGIS